MLLCIGRQSLIDEPIELRSRGAPLLRGLHLRPLEHFREAQLLHETHEDLGGRRRNRDVAILGLKESVWRGNWVVIAVAPRRLARREVFRCKVSQHRDHAVDHRRLNMLASTREFSGANRVDDAKCAVEPGDEIRYWS